MSIEDEPSVLVDKLFEAKDPRTEILSFQEGFQEVLRLIGERINDDEQPVVMIYGLPNSGKSELVEMMMRALDTKGINYDWRDRGQYEPGGFDYRGVTGVIIRQQPSHYTPMDRDVFTENDSPRKPAPNVYVVIYNPKMESTNYPSQEIIEDVDVVISNSGSHTK